MQESRNNLRQSENKPAPTSQIHGREEKVSGAWQNQPGLHAD